MKIMGIVNYRKSQSIILVPYPAQGHVTPMLKLASSFLNFGFKPFLVTPEFIHHKIITSSSNVGISFMSIPDGMEKDVPCGFFEIEEAMEKSMPVHLERIVRELDGDGGGVACVILDLLASPAVEVAHRCGVPVAGFWPAMLATYNLISAIPDMVRTGLISDSGIPQHHGPIRYLPNQPVISAEDLPWLIGTPAARKRRFKFWQRALDRSKSLPSLLVNSFPEEDVETNKPQGDYAVLENHASQPNYLQVGPLNKNALMVKNPSFWQEDMSCLQWLNFQKPSSVVYISFGSWVSPIGEGTIANLALALEAIGQPFIWVLGSAWRKGLPDGFLNRVSKQGKVISWAPQMEILQHHAVGCYLTHCGWNSTLEAIQCQKRLLCYPVAGDQFLNCAYIVDKWKIGVRINGFGKKNFEDCWRKVMEDDDEMKYRLKRLHEITVGDKAGLRIAANLAAFVDDLEKLRT